MSTEPVFTITYWGTTGTLSAPLRPIQVTEKLIHGIEILANEGRLANLTPGPDLRQRIEEEVAKLPMNVRASYGGNTTCVELQTPDSLLIIDCGSGFRELGLELARRWNVPGYQGSRSAHVLVTHPHLDHTMATAFFAPHYNPKNHFTIWGTNKVLKSMSAVLSPDKEMSSVYFPPTYDMLQAIKKTEEIKAGDTWSIGSTTIRTAALNHPGGCLAFRFENAGRTFVFATDHEQKEVPDPTLLNFARGADLLYTEGQYTLAEYEGREVIPGEAVALSRKGWGHSPVEWCARTAVAAGVKKLHIGHHDPARRDDHLEQIEKSCQHLARELTPEGQPVCEIEVPYEGQTFQL